MKNNFEIALNAVKENGLSLEFCSKDLRENEADRYISLSLEKYCSVGATINDKTTINHSFEIIR